ncbi:hypothetical protein N9N67_04355 [Bacteriovoracaceae bacterium]|nr:hypothetical protein [Bacteriovoracaceae bacterium]
MTKLIQISSSGKTLYFTGGKFDGLVENDRGIIVDVIKIKGLTRLKPIAVLKSVFVGTNHSIWNLLRTIEPETNFKRGRRFLLFSNYKFNLGRKELDISHGSVVGNRSNFKEDLLDYLSTNSEKLALKIDRYQQLETLHGSSLNSSNGHSDAHLTNIDKWEQEGFKGSYKFPKAIYRSAHASEFRRNHKIETFQKMVVSLLKKYNDPIAQFEISYLTDFSEGTVSKDEVKNIRESILSFVKMREKREKIPEESMYDELYVEDASWSDEYSKAELSDILTETGKVHERHRRESTFGYIYNNQWYFGTGLNLLNNENTADNENTTREKISFSISYESYLFKTLESFNRLTLELQLRYSKDGTSVGYINGLVTETSAAFNINFYPFQMAQSVNTNIFYFSLYSRFGVATMETPSLGIGDTYALSSFPGIKANVKYNFTNQMGLRVYSSFETIQLDRITDNTDLLPNREEYFDGRIGIALSYIH